MPARRPLLAALALVAALSAAGCSSRPAAPPAASPAPTEQTTAPSPAPSPTSTGAPVVVAALGDSLSRGTDACAGYGDCPAVSWSTGDDARVDSVASRFGTAVAAPVRRVNAARSGAVVAELAGQVDTALAARPDLVTMLIGANDVCRDSVEAMTPSEDYAAAVGDAIDRLSTGAPDATLLVASVPDVTALLPAVASDETARFIWSRADLCPIVLTDPTSDAPDVQARRAAVRLRIAEYDAALQAACATAPRCVYDDGALTAYRPAPKQVSALDAFHPSISGLRQLASIEWAALEPRLSPSTPTPAATP